MHYVNIGFTLTNQQLLREGKKTTTLRTNSQAVKIGMSYLQSSLCVIDDVTYKVVYLGEVYVTEVPDIWRTEGFDYTGGPKFESTREFLRGERTLHLYSLERYGE